MAYLWISLIYNKKTPKTAFEELRQVERASCAERGRRYLVKPTEIQTLKESPTVRCVQCGLNDLNGSKR